MALLLPVGSAVVAGGSYLIHRAFYSKDEEEDQSVVIATKVNDGEEDELQEPAAAPSAAEPELQEPAAAPSAAEPLAGTKEVNKEASACAPAACSAKITCMGQGRAGFSTDCAPEAASSRPPQPSAALHSASRAARACGR